MSRSFAALAVALLAVPLQAWAQQASTLTPQDYIAIQQLVSKYAYAIDEYKNRGHDYADLYMEFDTAHRVTTMIVQGDGCSSCSGGRCPLPVTRTCWCGCAPAASEGRI